MSVENKVNVFNYISSNFEPHDLLPQDDSYWKSRLSDEEFSVMRKKGTEKPFRNKYNDNKKTGLYVCKGCGNHLYHSDGKFDSGTGWPSFTQPVNSINLKLLADKSFSAARVEVVCSICNAHLGHVFDDGPAPEGKRYCMNSSSMNFIEE